MYERGWSKTKRVRKRIKWIEKWVKVKDRCGKVQKWKGMTG